MTLTDFLTGIADAIRYAENSTDEINAQNFATRIRALSSVTPTPTPVTPTRPDVPQTGYWQLKTTTDKKYLIIGTDDDVEGNTKFFRLLRSYNLPYTMNVTAEYLNRQLGADTADYFTDTDAESVFPSGATVKDLAKYLVTSGLGEVALHGISDKVLWNSNKLVGDTLTTIYNTYVTSGGTKTEDEFKSACMNSAKDTDIAQDASYVSTSRATIESAIESLVYTCGIWGGEPTVTIDGISVNLKLCRDFSYPFRANNYSGASTNLSLYVDNTSAHDISRDSAFLSKLNVLKDNVSVGKVIELFIHNTQALDVTSLRASLAEVKSMVDSGEIAVVTRKQYADMGEYVANPIKSLSVSRTSTTINVGDTDAKSEYTVTATYMDNTTADVTSEAIVKTITDTTEAKVVSVPTYYRGFTATVDVEISSGSGSIYIEPFVITSAKISTSGAIAGGTGKVLRYDVTGLDKFYFNASKRQAYYIGYTTDAITSGDLSNFSNSTYFSVGTNEVTVPDGMNYFYVNSSTASGIDVYPWAVTNQAIQ